MKKLHIPTRNIVLLLLIGLTSVTASCDGPNPAPISDDALQEQLLERERQFLAALQADDAAAIRELSGDDGFYVHPPGIQPIEQIIEDMYGYTVESFTMGPPVHFHRIGDDAAALAYALTIAWPRPMDLFMTAIYVNRNGQWVGIYRAETRK